jgi:N-dimethylarginine dimethylaminohydrolase
MNKYIKKVLMCKPLHFSVDYIINPWMMPGTVNRDKAMEQWSTLVDTFQRLQIKVETIDQEEGLPDMVFSADQAVVKNKKVLISNFRYPERQGETKHYLKWFKKHRYSLVHLPATCFFEGGGESTLIKDLLLIGVGFRANLKVCRQVSKTFDIEVVPLELVDKRFYHLDTCFFPLNNETAFYFPEGFSPDARIKLKKIIPNLIPFNYEELLNFAANSVVTDHHVVMQKNNPVFKKEIKNQGYKTVEVDVGEFIKAGGGIHCLMQVLKEEHH